MVVVLGRKVAEMKRMAVEDPSLQQTMVVVLGRTFASSSAGSSEEAAIVLLVFFFVVWNKKVVPNRTISSFFVSLMKH